MLLAITAFAESARVSREENEANDHEGEGLNAEKNSNLVEDLSNKVQDFLLSVKEKTGVKSLFSDRLEMMPADSKPENEVVKVTNIDKRDPENKEQFSENKRLILILA